MSLKVAFSPAAAWLSLPWVIELWSGGPSREKWLVFSSDPLLAACVDHSQVDAIVYTVNAHGFFAQAGPLRLFVSSHVRDTIIRDYAMQNRFG
jgi:hypothetical protein